MNFFQKNQVLALLSIAFLVRISLFLFSSSQGEHSFYLFDSFRHLHIGDHLFEYGIYAEKISEPLFESVYVTPGAPLLFYFLRQLGGIEAIILFQIICQLFLVIVLIRTVKILFPNKETSSVWICGFLYAFDIPSIVLGNVIMTETVFTLILFGAVYRLLIYFTKNNPKHLIQSSFLLGTAVLFRPILIYFPLFLIAVFVFIFMQKKSWNFGNLIRIILPFYLIAGTWIFINYQKHGHFFYSLVGDFNLMHFQAAHILSEKEGISIEEARLNLNEQIRSSFDPSEYEKVDQVIYYRRAGKIARNVILKNPVLFIKNAAKANINLFFRPVRDYLKITLGSNELFHTRSKNHSFFIKITSYWQIFINVLSFLLIIPGWIYLYRRFPEFSLFLLTFLLYFMLVCSGPEVDGRFRVPLVPVTYILATAGIFFILEKIQKKAHSPSSNNSTFVP